MRTKSFQLLVTATGNLLQQHAFDHLSDEKLSRMNQCISRLNRSGLLADLTLAEEELLELYGEANLYTETATPASIQQWLTVMNSFGKNIMPDQGLLEEAE